MTMCIIPLGIHHLPARKQQEELHKGLGSFDWVSLTLALKWYYTVPVKDHACPRKFCLPRSLNKACNSSSPFYLTIQQSLLQEQRWLCSAKLPYMLERTAFSSLVTDRQDRQTDTSLHVIFSFFWHTLGWLCTFQLCRGCWPPACLQSAAGESAGTPGRTFWEHPQKPSVTAGKGLHLSCSPLTNFHWDELAGSQWQPLPGPTTAKAKKRTWVNNFQE